MDIFIVGAIRVYDKYGYRYKRGVKYEIKLLRL